MIKCFILSVLIASIIFLVIDVIWLSFATKSFYRPLLGDLISDKPVLWAAVLFYILCLINMFLDFSYTSDLVFAWGFVIFRIIHFFFRLKNQRDLNIRPRTLAFVLSLIFLSLGWSSLFFNVISRYI